MVVAAQDQAALSTRLSHSRAFRSGRPRSSASPLPHLSFAYAAYLIVHALFYGRPVEGWTTTIVVMLGLGGLQLFVLGMLGEYLWRVGDEVRRRPLFLVQELAGKFSPAAPKSDGPGQ